MRSPAAWMVLGIVALAGPARAQGSERVREVTLAEALAAAGPAPEHVAAAARTVAASRAAKAAGGAPPTLVTVGTSRIQGKLTTAVTLPLPVFGRLGAERSVARANAAVARAAEGKADLGLHDVTVAWLELARRQARAQLAGDTAARAKELASAAQHRFEAGDAAREETVTANASAARARAEASAARAEESVAATDLAALLGWDPSAGLRAKGGLPEKLPPPPSLARLRARLGDHPDVREADAKVAVALAQVTESSRGKWPVLSAGVETDSFDPTLPGTDVRGLVNLELPLFGHHLAARDAAEAERMAAAADRASTRFKVAGALVSAYRMYEEATARAATFAADVVPAERESARLATIGYREGKGGLVSVLQAERALLEVEGELIDARAAAASAYADLEQAAGGGRW